MSDFRKAGKGSISRRERESDKHPDWKGSITLDCDVKAGTKLWLSGWTKQSEAGEWVSLSAEPPRATDSAAGSKPKPQSRPATSMKDQLDDEIPF